MADNYNNMVPMLKKILDDKGITQKQLAKVSGVNETTISMILSGRRKMSEYSWIRIHDALEDWDAKQKKEEEQTKESTPSVPITVIEDLVRYDALGFVSLSDSVEVLLARYHGETPTVEIPSMAKELLRKTFGWGIDR